MSAAVRTFILTFATLCGSTVGSGILSRPTNVSLTSYNMNLVLRWSPPEGAARNVVYTTEYNTTVSPYTVACVNISTFECDLTRLNTSTIWEYGKYTGRVRAQLGSDSSAWVESNPITLDKDTIIGSPTVSLFSNGATLEVSIEDPVFVVSELRQALNRSPIQQNRVVLSGLDPKTKYCVQVQINTDSNPHPSKPSAVVCESTGTDESPWTEAMITFVLMAVGVVLVVVGVGGWGLCTGKISPRFFVPRMPCLSISKRFYLLAPPDSTIYQAMKNSHPREEFCHQIRIVTDHRTVEAGSL
ncbi:hypothetical protein INR49_030017 [Caranx melampygus]|nr:hypothetical protein INR49_030017 [Caranx melampygus]